MSLTEQEKILRQRGYCKTYYQKNKERIKEKKKGNEAWLALEEEEKQFIKLLPREIWK